MNNRGIEMRRVVIIIAIITCAIFGLMFYQYHVQKQEVEQFDIYQSVLNDKTTALYEQAKDWSKPIVIDTQDSRLAPDFQVMADFMLHIMVKNAELRNSYLRNLKDAQWDKFLDVQRLEQDKKNNYVETEQMLNQVDEMINVYQKSLDEHQQEIQKEIKALPIKARFRRYLTEALVKNAELDGDQKLFNLEKQSYAKAQQAFTILKSQKWEVKNNTFLFENQNVVNEFNQLFQDMLALDKQMKQISQSTKKELEKTL
jgi:hypothetical protein